jgi:hypothetical protein
MPGSTTLRMRISDMLRLEGENIFSIGAGLEITQILRAYEKLEKREDNLKAYLKAIDDYAFREIVTIDAEQDRQIARILTLAFRIIAENQASNKLIDHYDPKRLQLLHEQEEAARKAQIEIWDKKNDCLQTVA